MLRETRYARALVFALCPGVSSLSSMWPTGGTELEKEPAAGAEDRRLCGTQEHGPVKGRASPNLPPQLLEHSWLFPS